MRVPLSWLKEHVDITVPVEELAHRLTLAGLEVASIQYIGLPAGELTGMSSHLAVPVSTDHLVWDRDKIVIGHVVEVKQHPDADRLTLAMVESGVGEIETVVNGAVNLQPYVDKGIIDPPLVVAYSREGAELLDPYAENWPEKRMVLKPKKLRGIMNKSMVCSHRELGLSDEHEGIILLQSDAAPGTPLQDVLGDVILDIDLTPNLARCFSILGVAREVAALLDTELKPVPQEVKATGRSIEGQVALDIQEPELNPRFTLALIKGVEIADSPEWMQRRLKQVGMRPINNIVDITNYVMLETGQPLHSFDYDVLVERAGGKAPTIITRSAKPGESLTTLDGVERELDDFTEMVADTAGNLSIAGVMGGLESEVYDARTHVLDAQGVEMGSEEAPTHGKADARPESTVNVLLESASWNFINVRETLGAQRERGKEINSEAGARFSRGVHPAQAEVGLRRAIELMREIAGGEVAQGILDAYPLPAEEVVVALPISEVTRLLGIEIPTDEVVDILQRLQFKVEQAGAETLRITAPDHRLDIGYVNDPKDLDIHDLIAQADLIEEIARIYGYDRIPDSLIQDELPPQRANPSLHTEERIRDLLVKQGLQEVITYRLTSPQQESLLTPADAESHLPDMPMVTLKNPSSSEMLAMRRTLLGGLIRTASLNARWQKRQALFEVGTVYLTQEGELLPNEQGRIGLLLTGEREVPNWENPNARPEMMDFYDLKGAVEGLCYGLHLENVRFEATEHNSFFPGRAAALKAGNKEKSLGVIGELHPLVQQNFDLPDQPILIAELDLDAIIALVDDMHKIKAPSNFPAVYQDIALIVDESVPAQAVEQAIRQAGGWLLQDVRLFDVYRGEQIGAGKKSLAYALTIQASDKTLRDKDADKVRGRIVKSLETELGAVLRG